AADVERIRAREVEDPVAGRGEVVASRVDSADEDEPLPAGELNRHGVDCKLAKMTLAVFYRMAGLIWVLMLSAANAAPSAEQMKRGEKLFTEKCAMCHQPNGAGVPPVYPPLARSEWLTTK